MKPKTARRLLRKYEWKMLAHRAGIEEAPSWLLKLWDKAVQAVLLENDAGGE
jgi:hypothetical protein